MGKMSEESMKKKMRPLFFHIPSANIPLTCIIARLIVINTLVTSRIITSTRRGMRFSSVSLEIGSVTVLHIRALPYECIGFWQSSSEIMLRDD